MRIFAGFSEASLSVISDPWHFGAPQCLYGLAEDGLQEGG